MDLMGWTWRVLRPPYPVQSDVTIFVFGPTCWCTATIRSAMVFCWLGIRKRSVVSHFRRMYSMVFCLLIPSLAGFEASRANQIVFNIPRAGLIRKQERCFRPFRLSWGESGRRSFISVRDLRSTRGKLYLRRMLRSSYLHWFDPNYFDLIWDVWLINQPRRHHRSKKRILYSDDWKQGKLQISTMKTRPFQIWEL